jgi:hypothetical protein
MGIPPSTSGASHITAHINRIVRPHFHLDKPHLLTLTSIARVQLANVPATINGPSAPPPCRCLVPPSNAATPQAAYVVQDFKATTIRHLER